MNREELERMAMMQGLSSPEAPPVSDDFSKWRLQMDDIIDIVEHHLRGERWDSANNVWTEGGVRIMNEEGVVSISSTLSMFLNKVVFLSNFTEDDVITITKNVHKTICIDLYYNWQKWDFKKEYNVIVRKIALLVYMGLKRAQEEGERLALRQSERIVRTFAEGDKKGRFPSIGLPFGGDKE